MMKQIKTKLLILSDTHGDYELIKIIRDLELPDQIIHCGDHGLNHNELDSLEMIYVTGNNDWIGDVQKSFRIDKFKFILTHGHIIPCRENIVNGLYEKYKDEHPDFILYGHTHKDKIDHINNTYIINPGALAYPKNETKQKTYVILNIYQDHNFDIIVKSLN